MAGSGLLQPEPIAQAKGKEKYQEVSKNRLYAAHEIEPPAQHRDFLSEVGTVKSEEPEDIGKR